MGISSISDIVIPEDESTFSIKGIQSGDKEKHYRKVIDEVTKSAGNLKRLDIYVEDKGTREDLKQISGKMLSETIEKKDGETLFRKIKKYSTIAGTVAGAAIGFSYFNELAGELQGQKTMMDEVYKYTGMISFTALGSLTGRLAGYLSIPKTEDNLKDKIERYQAFYDAVQR